MKAKLTPIKSYKVEIDGVNHGTFEKTGEMSGMIKLTKGKQIIVADTNMNSTIFDAFDSEYEAEIVKISPSLVK